MNEPQEYLLRWRGRVTGPFPVPEINRRLDEHEIGTGHEIFYEQNWITLGEFLAAISQPVVPTPAEEPPLLPTGPLMLRPIPVPIRVKVAPVGRVPGPKAREADAVRGPRPRHRLLFAFLAFVGGFLGAHNFYARQWLTGLLQLFLSVATFLMGFGIIASWIWAMAEAVFIRKDGDGVEMI